MIGDDDDPENQDEAVSAATPVDDSVEPKTYRGKQRDLAIRESEREQFWGAVLSSDIGRREIYGVLKDAHFDEDRFMVGPAGVPDPLASWCERGAQAFGYRLFLTLMRYARPGVLQMLDEHDARLAEIKRPRRKSR